jgi:hypothetical protein
MCDDADLQVAQQSRSQRADAMFCGLQLCNDQFDGLSAPNENRYDPLEVRLLLERVGLRRFPPRRFGPIAAS